MVSSETIGTFSRDTVFPVKEEAHLLMFALTPGEDGLLQDKSRFSSLQAAQGKVDRVVKPWLSNEGPAQVVLSTPLYAIWQVEESGWDFLLIILA